MEPALADPNLKILDSHGTGQDCCEEGAIYHLNLYNAPVLQSMGRNEV